MPAGLVSIYPRLGLGVALTLLAYIKAMITGWEDQDEPDRKSTTNGALAQASAASQARRSEERGSPTQDEP